MLSSILKATHVFPETSGGLRIFDKRKALLKAFVLIVLSIKKI